MSFTEDEKRYWHEEKRKREYQAPVQFRTQPVAICIHCSNPFGIGEGVITDDVALCDTCNGD